MKAITIIGGGLAGLTLGIALRQREVPVTVIEAGRYPRHRVCGEFISGDGIGVLDRLGLLELVKEAGARPAFTAAFFTGTRACGVRALPEPAWCIARHQLDVLLARQFCELNGTLEIETRAKPSAEEGVVLATGRRIRPVDRGWRWFGLKGHAHNVNLRTDLEMHFARDSYVGLCRLANGVVNVCGLFRRKTPTSGLDMATELRGTRGSLLFTRLEHARFVPDSMCAVAGLSLAREPIDPSGARVGDAVTMIPPITGNGMSMAFESAEVASAPLAKYARGDCSWNDATREIATQFEERFSRRLFWAAALHKPIFHWFAFAIVLPLVARSSSVWERAFHLTRSAARTTKPALSR